jgi:ParB family chromosome partitioning protein
MRIEDIKISLIDRSDDRRVVSPQWASAISADMAVNGQLTPIEVVETGDRFRLIDGGHRIDGRVMLGATDIKAIVRTMAEFRSEADLKLREIASNMVRRGLSVLDKAWDVWRWREVYESVHGAVKAGRKKNGGKFAPISEDEADAASEAFASSFTAASQAALGLNKDQIKRFLRIAAIQRPLQEKISLHPIADNQSELLALAAEPEARRELIVALLISEPAKATSVAQAIGIIDQVPAAAKAEAWEKLSGKFTKLGEAQQRRFLIENWAVIEQLYVELVAMKKAA